MKHYFQVTYCAVVGTTLSLSSILAYHDLSQEFWDSLQWTQQNELIESYLEESGIGHEVKLRTRKEKRLEPPTPQNTPSFIERNSKLDDLLKFSGSWVGDDLQDCLQAVYDNRTEAEF